jgi:hypothetical protein
MKTDHLCFAETLRRAHAALENHLRELVGAARAPSGGRLADLGGRLKRTRARLAEHFVLEEENGYMDAVLQRDPNREREVGHLHEQHHLLMESLDALIGRTTGGGETPKDLRDEVLAWVEAVREHESREDALVQEAFNRDLSAED